jgi:hypothetical protein
VRMHRRDHMFNLGRIAHVGGNGTGARQLSR